MSRLAAALLAIGVLFAPLPAAAAVLWFGGEDTSFVQVGTVTTSTANATYNATYSRASVGVSNTTSTSDPPANRMTTTGWTGSCSGNPCWVHAAFYAVQNTTTNNEQALWLGNTSDGLGRLYVRQTGTAGTFKISTATAARSFTDVLTFTSTWSAALHTLDLAINYTCSGAGGITVYLDSVAAGTFSGNLCTDAVTAMNFAAFGGVSNGTNSCSVGINTQGACWSQVIIANEDTRSMVLATCTLQAAGNTQLWTPNTLANVNKAVISDATFVSTSSNNQLSQWTCPTAAPTGTWGVKSVSIEARMLLSTTGPQNFDWSWRIGGADYLAGTTTAGTNAFANYRLQQDTSPATSTAWGIAEIYNTSTNQLGIGVKSLP